MARIDGLVLVSRIWQIVMGLITLALCAAQASIGEMEDCYNYYANTFPAAAAACNAIIMLDGGVGLFAWRRPSDVHWHLTLSLDYLTLVVGLVSCALITTPASIDMGTTDGINFPVTVAATLFSYISLVTVLVPIIRTHQLKKQNKLPAPGAVRHEWYEMGNEATPTPK